MLTAARSLGLAMAGCGSSSATCSIACQCVPSSMRRSFACTAACPARVCNLTDQMNHTIRVTDQILLESQYRIRTSRL